MANAVLELLERADQGNWCIKIGCTTCGATEFRAAVARSAARIAADMPSTSLEELRRRLPHFRVEDALCLMVGELERRGRATTSGARNIAPLADTEIWTFVQSERLAWKEYSARRQAANAAKIENESQLAKQRREQRTAGHDQRVSEKAVRETSEKQALEALESAGPRRALAELVRGEFSVSPHRWPDSLVNGMVSSLSELSAASCASALEHVPRSRRLQWRAVRQELKSKAAKIQP